MFLLASEWAIFERLTGAPIDDKGRPQVDARGVPVNRSFILPPDVGGGLGPSYGVRLPVRINQQRAEVNYATSTPGAIRRYAAGFDLNSAMQVPVFDLDLEDRRWETTWPCVTFRRADMIPGMNGTHVYNDPFGPESRAKPGPFYYDPNATPVTAADGRQGFTSYRYRVHPDPWDVSYQIRVYAKTLTEVSLLEDQILGLFPRRGALMVEQADGTRVAQDFMFEGYANMDDAGGQVGRSVDTTGEAHFSRVYTYRLETYRDNSVTGFGNRDIFSRHAILETEITQRIFELQKKQEVILAPGNPEL